MFKIREKIGNIFALLVAVAFGILVYGSQPEKEPKEAGYKTQERQNLKNKFAEIGADFGDVPRLSLSDLDLKVENNGWKK